MKAVPTQFGDRNFSGAVATPTCSSCCCCCCCVATTVAGSIVLARTVRSEAKERNLSVPQVRLLTIVAAAIIPIAFILMLLCARLFMTNSLFNLIETLGTGPFIVAAVIAATALAFAITRIFSRISGKPAVARGITWAIALAILFAIELFLALMLLTGYAIAYPVLVVGLIVLAATLPLPKRS